MNIYYRYQNDDRYTEDDIILLKAIRPTDTHTPEWFEVVYSNVESHKKLINFIGSETKLLEKNVRPATDKEISLITDNSTERVEPSEGGCWFCYTRSDDMTFDTEFDTFLHINCLKNQLKENPNHPEAQIMSYLLD